MTTLIDLIGAVNNLGEPEPVLNRREAILGIVISFSIISWSCSLLRFYTRFRVMKSPWWDDFFVLMSSVSRSRPLSSSSSLHLSQTFRQYMII